MGKKNEWKDETKKGLLGLSIIGFHGSMNPYNFGIQRRRIKKKKEKSITGMKKWKGFYLTRHCLYLSMDCVLACTKRSYFPQYFPPLGTFCENKTILRKMREFSKSEVARSLSVRCFPRAAYRVSDFGKIQGSSLKKTTSETTWLQTKARN